MGRVSLFKNNEVVNLSDGRRLGFVSDADVNFETGRLESIMVAGAGKLFGASSKESELIISLLYNSSKSLYSFLYSKYVGSLLLS